MCKQEQFSLTALQLPFGDTKTNLLRDKAKKVSIKHTKCTHTHNEFSHFEK